MLLIGGQMLFFGIGCLVLFWVLAWLISRAIRDRVDAIELAKSEADSGRQTARRLMQEQQAANQELEELAVAQDRQDYEKKLAKDTAEEAGLAKRSSSPR